MDSVNVGTRCEGITNLKFSFIPDHGKQEAVVLIPDDKMTMISFKGNRVCCVSSRLLRLDSYDDANLDGVAGEFQPLQYNIRSLLNALVDHGLELSGYEYTSIENSKGLHVEMNSLKALFKQDPLAVCATEACSGDGSSGEVVGGATCPTCDPFGEISGPGEAVGVTCCCGCASC